RGGTRPSKPHDMAHWRARFHPRRGFSAQSNIRKVILLILLFLSGFHEPSRALDYAGALSDGYDGVDGLDGANRIAVSPDGKHVYTAAFRDHAVGLFARDVSTGGLTFIRAVKDGEGGANELAGGYGIAVSPDGKHVYYAGYSDDALSIFARNASTGDLTFVDAVKNGEPGAEKLNGAIWPEVSADGKNVYLTSEDDNALTVFSRDPSTGELSFMQVFEDGVEGVDGLGSAVQVSVSPDGSNVYVAGWGDAAISTFGRNTESGLLTYLGAVENEEPDVDGLNGVHSVTLSPDGKHMYAVTYLEHAVSLFSRDGSSGALTYIETLHHGENGACLQGAYSVVVGHDGQYVYVPAYGSGALNVFSRDALSGSLSVAQVFVDGSNGADSLAGARFGVLSPDGTNLYVTAHTDNAISVFGDDAALPPQAPLNLQILPP
ncbi:MAG: beta-propeller fold lactonase family protein, partial [Kiritimatiellae bacterium]|nr:beta-propeller fold lactonase family protein [Kiritimatiellia bacterium]